MTRKQRRLSFIGAAGGVLAVAVGLVLYALTGQIVFFYTPSDIAAHPIAPGTRVRLGGLVEDGSVQHGDNGRVAFSVTDTQHQTKVTYTGLLPDLFREGQGVVAEGVYDANGMVTADNVLAKHDEKYMPPEVAAALKKQGVWEGDKQTAEKTP
ncbi:cytochrome c-type biogenesis protein CcmE [Faunimonas pinastri]|uniref:Cytochrome c-type biogenesis protein CcmE n=1 Tax=Faunimonas pinastri TaxID=1855383 RepID=A0A1H9L0N5_9HYPH|nr:cytochrome c maturation protein CcmE [Faunimonas pinastri]SER04878.1 cytochrome c-type biogenesis protein CcmE [Faunimonas pinastri]